MDARVFQILFIIVAVIITVYNVYSRFFTQMVIKYMIQDVPKICVTEICLCHPVKFGVCLNIYSKFHFLIRRQSRTRQESWER